MLFEPGPWNGQQSCAAGSNAQTLIKQPGSNAGIGLIETPESDAGISLIEQPGSDAGISLITHGSRSRM